MKKAPIPENEEARLQALKKFGILDTQPEKEFDEITKLAATVCETKIALVSLIDSNRQWFKSKYGLSANETSREISYCGHAIMGDEVFEISDSKLNPDFCDNPLYLNEPHVRFYAGAPLITEEGYRIGTLCVIDSNTKKLSELQKKILKSLSKQVVNLLEIKLKKHNLNVANSQFEKAQALSKIGSWEYNLITQEQTWSSQHYKIFEIPEPQSKSELFQLYRERIHPEDVKKLDELMLNAIQKGEDFVFDHRIVLDNGKRIKYVQGAGTVTRDQSGKPTLISGTCRDRTIEIENDVRYQTLLETMSEGLVVQNQKGEIIQYNKSALKILDMTPEQITGKKSTDPVWKAIHPDGSIFNGVDHPAMVAIRTNKPQIGIKMGLKYESSPTRWIQINAVPFLRKNEIHIICTFNDITELVAYYEENQFILSSLGIGVWKFTPKTQNLVWDQSLYNLYGIRPEEFSGHYNAWESSLTPEAKAKAIEDLTLALEGKKEFNTTFEITNKQGEKKKIAGKGKVIRNEAGDPIIMYGINWDISKEAQLQDELEEQRAMAIHQSKLVSMGEISAGIAHEINNPITVVQERIKFALELINKEDKLHKDKIVSSLEVALKNINRSTQIIKNLKSLSRTNSNDVLVSESISSVIHEVTDLFKEKLKNHHIRFESKIPTQSKVKMIHSQIGQILSNLLNNSFDAVSAESEKWITLSVTESENKVRISVTDSGKGIPAEIKKKLMQPFFTTKPIGLGTGLGLSISKQIANKHGGTLYLDESKPNTCFVLELPLDSSG